MLIKESPNANAVYLNINKEGKLYRKNKEGNIETYASLKGRLTGVELYTDETYKKEKIKLFVSSDENYILQMNVDSGYFRGFCNSLKSGNPKNEITITPFSKIGEKGVAQTTCFVNQDGKFLKHYFSKSFNGTANDILPELKSFEFKGETKFDNTEQLKYWKNWLQNLFTETSEEDEELVTEKLPF